MPLPTGNRAVEIEYLKGWTSTQTTGLNMFPNPRTWLSNVFHLKVSLKGLLRPTRTEIHENHTQSRTSTISPPGAAKAASRHWDGGVGGGEGEKARSEKSEGGPRTPLSFSSSPPLGPLSPPTHQPLTVPDDVPPSSLKRLWQDGRRRPELLLLT